METTDNTTRLAQSASALGAGILGFGIGAKWGMEMGKLATLAIVPGAVIHVYGMYIMQMKNRTAKTYGVAKLLWISAWICLLALLAIGIYLIIR